MEIIGGPVTDGEIFNREDHWMGLRDVSPDFGLGFLVGI